MMLYLLSTLIAVLLVELAQRVIAGERFRNKLQEVAILLHHFYKAKSDNERQQLILSSAFKTLKISLVFFVWIIFFAVIIFTGPWLLDFNQNQNTSYFISLSIVGTLWSIFCYLRSISQRKIKSRSDMIATNHYNRIERYMHWFALQPILVRQLSFDLDRTYALPSPHITHSTCPTAGPVYVCGLARSGTTMLLRILDEIDIFRSLSYRDMPFVLAPNLWNLLTRFSSKQARSTERAHRDGIIVNYDSPEAFEEVFWRTFCPNHANQQGYSTAVPTTEVLDAFADYRALVANPKLKRTDTNNTFKRYLSKNNNNLLRLESLSADPTATILLVYRNPVDTARSLYRLHQQFCVTYKNDDFAKAYMKWLGHHEFGPGHQPFRFAIPEMTPSLSPDDPNYWLDYWNAIYRHVLKHNSLRYHLIEHEVMRAKPKEMIQAICATLSIVADYSTLAELIKPEESSKVNPDEFDERILLQAKQTHYELQTSEKNIKILGKYYEKSN